MVFFICKYSKDHWFIVQGMMTCDTVFKSEHIYPLFRFATELCHSDRKSWPHIMHRSSGGAGGAQAPYRRWSHGAPLEPLQKICHSFFVGGEAEGWSWELQLLWLNFDPRSVPAPHATHMHESGSNRNPMRAIVIVHRKILQGKEYIIYFAEGWS